MEGLASALATFLIVPASGALYVAEWGACSLSVPMGATGACSVMVRCWAKAGSAASIMAIDNV